LLLVAWITLAQSSLPLSAIPEVSAMIVVCDSPVGAM